MLRKDVLLQLLFGGGLERLALEDKLLLLVALRGDLGSQVTEGDVLLGDWVSGCRGDNVVVGRA